MREFSRSLETFLKGTSLFPDEDLHMEVLLNPASGILSQEKRWRPFLDFIESHSREESPGRTVDVRITIPENREKNFSALEEGVARLKAQSGRALLITAGGDGFHRDCLIHLLQIEPRALESLILFRFPLGTGNDTPLVTDPREALQLFLKPIEPVPDHLIQVTTARGITDYALNVASFGLDAFVCLLTEKWKGRLKGDIYKIMVDVSTLFYDFYHRTRVSRLTLYGEGEENPLIIEKRILMNVFGRRGHTDYGGGKKILPGPENHLVTGMFSIPGKIMLKGLFMKGGHWPGRRKVNFFFTEKMVLDYPAPLLMELDGELTRLGKEDFPLTLTREAHRISVIN